MPDALLEIEAVHGPVRIRKGLVRCRVCRCSDAEPCGQGHAWATADARGDLCLSCAIVADRIANWIRWARQPRRAALLREAKMRAYRETDD